MEYTTLFYVMAQYLAMFAGLVAVCYGMARFLVYAADHERSRSMKKERRDHDFFDGR